MEKEEKNKNEVLWEEFLSLVEKNKDKFTIPDFAGKMLVFVFKMMYDTAPSREVVKEIAEHAMNAAYDWHEEGV
jgi:hypothetical protein